MEQPTVTQSELETHLWESANILRGPIDQADFKSYVFPLLFLKRICDVYDEEFQQALDESDGDVDYAAFAENHRFQVPEGATGPTCASERRTSVKPSSARCAHRAGQPEQALRHLRRHPVDEQGAPAGLAAARPHRPLLQAAAGEQPRRSRTSSATPTSISSRSSPTSPTRRPASSTRRARS